MQQADVVSSNIAKVGYDGVSLFIKFNSGESYGCVGAPPGIFTQLVEAEVCWPGVSPTREEQVPHGTFNERSFRQWSKEAQNASGWHHKESTQGLYELTPLDGPFTKQKSRPRRGRHHETGTCRLGRLRSVWGFYRPHRPRV